MRKILLTATIALATMSVSAQGLYLKAGVGYNVPVTKSLYQDQEASATATVSSTFNGVNNAKGILPSLTLGYMFNENIGIELGAGYNMGNDHVLTSKLPTTGGTTTESKTTIRSRMLALYPAIKLAKQFGESNVGIYSRTGFMVPVTGSTITKRDATTTLGGNTVNTINAEVETKGSPTIGLAGGLGLTFDINEQMALFTEVNGQAAKVWAKESKMTKYVANGTDGLSALPVYAKETLYHRELNSSSNNALYRTPDTGKPMDDMVRETDFSALGIAVGIQIKF